MISFCHSTSVLDLTVSSLKPMASLHFWTSVAGLKPTAYFAHEGPFVSYGTPSYEPFVGSYPPISPFASACLVPSRSYSNGPSQFGSSTGPSIVGFMIGSIAGNSVRHVIHNVTCGPTAWSPTAYFARPASRYASSGLHTTTNNVTRPMLKAENPIVPYIHLPINAIEPTVSYLDLSATNHVCQEGATLNNSTKYLGNIPLLMVDGTSAYIECLGS